MSAHVDGGSSVEDEQRLNPIQLCGGWDTSIQELTNLSNLSYTAKTTFIALRTVFDKLYLVLPHVKMCNIETLTCLDIK